MPLTSSPPTSTPDEHSAVAASPPHEHASRPPAAKPATGALGGRRIIVVGAGFGGLAAACYLARDGADVTVIEKNEQAGGRASRLVDGGFTFDMGPSWYLMPDVFERFFGHFGKRPQDYFALERLDPRYRIYFKGAAGPSGGGAASGAARIDIAKSIDIAERGEIAERTDIAERVDITDDRAAMRALFESFEAGAGDALERYLARSRQTYERAMPGFVFTDRPRLRDFISLDVVRRSRGLALLGTMERFVSRYFRHPRLRQIVQYSLVFLGGSPRNTPALYHLMGHVDFDLGVHYPQPGGIGAVVDALVALATELGVHIETGRAVTSIRPAGERARARGAEHAQAADARAEGRRRDVSIGALTVVTDDGAEWPADAVVSNADYRHTEEALLAPRHRRYSRRYWRRRTWAPSAFLLYLGVDGDVPELAHHTLVLPDDWEPHFRQLFDAPGWPEDPAYYVCAPSKTDPTVAPPGCTNLFVLVPIAAGLDDGPEVSRRYRELILDDVERSTGASLRDRILVEHTFSVSDFARRYNAAEGSALGLAHTLGQSAFARPARRSNRLPGLYFTGSYTTPGIGMPMCLISGQHTARAVVEDMGRRAATPGGSSA